jgi:hypothetical protein
MNSDASSQYDLSHDDDLSDRHRASLERETKSHERRIDEAVLRLYEVDSFPL